MLCAFLLFIGCAVYFISRSSVESTKVYLLPRSPVETQTTSTVPSPAVQIPQPQTTSSPPEGWKAEYSPLPAPNGKVPEFKGEPVIAYIDGGGKKSILHPDQQGAFPRQYLNASEEVKVTLEFPNALKGGRVVVTALDGGYFGNHEGPVELLNLSDALTADITFTLSTNPGVSRVAIQKGTEITTLDLWAGDDSHRTLVEKK